MRALAFVDLHGSMKSLHDIKEKIRKYNVEIILCAGDITIFETDIEKIMHEINRIGLPVLMIHGNHESEKRMEDLCKENRNIKFIHKRSYKIGNRIFFGYGGGGFSTVDKHFLPIAERFKKDLDKGLKIIVITHAPPYGTEVDLILNNHCGNKSIREFLKDVKADIAICGHLHENSGVFDKLGKTILVNPGPKGEILEL